MVKGKLPKIKKNFKSFLTEEDAKISDEVFTKIAIITTFIGTEFLTSMSSVSAGHSEHYNEITTSSNGTIISNTGGTTIINSTLNNQQNSVETIKILKFPITEPGKSISAVHANHYDHQDGGGYGIWPPSDWFK